MKKIYLLAIITVLYSAQSFADDDDWGYQGYYGQPQVSNNYYYSQQPQGYGYYPQPQINNYYPQPQSNYYPPQPQYYGYSQQYNGYNQPSSHGLAGSIIGDVVGYELGNGNPIASGLGATAGAILGNGFYMGY